MAQRVDVSVGLRVLEAWLGVGHRPLARAMNVHESQISRWKGDGYRADQGALRRHVAALVSAFDVATVEQEAWTDRIVSAVATGVAPSEPAPPWREGSDPRRKAGRKPGSAWGVRSRAPRPSSRQGVLPLVLQGVEQAVDALRRGEEARGRAVLEGVLRIARQARQVGLAAVLVGVMLAGVRDAQGQDSGSSVRKDVQVQVLSSAIESLLRWFWRRVRAVRAAGSSRRVPALSAVQAYASIISLDDVRAFALQPKHLSRAIDLGKVG